MAKRIVKTGDRVEEFDTVSYTHLAVSDRVTVIRRGKSIETVEIGGATNQDLARCV